VTLTRSLNKLRTKAAGSGTGAKGVTLILTQYSQQGTVILRQDILSFFLPENLKAANSLRSNNAAFLTVFSTKKLEYLRLVLMCSWLANTCVNINKEPFAPVPESGDRLISIFSYNGVLSL
jgi:hypothetical protein